MPVRKFRCIRKYAKPWKQKKATQLRRNMTWPEKMLWSRLRDKQIGVNCYAQRVVLGYILDIWIPSAGMCVEIDGASHLARKAYDANRDSVLGQRGIITMRFKNEEVMKNLNAVVALIKAKTIQRLK